MSDVLFARELPVIVKSQVSEDRRAVIKINVETVTTTSPLHKKELVVRLTDDKDLFFLYTLRLGEEDFQSLKTQQGLLVDFSAFPQKFIDLLQLCLQEEKSDNPKYLLQFMCPPISGSDRDTWSLNVVETNPFKHLTHLSLRFLPGKDTDVKSYLADCLKIAKNEIARLSTTLSETDSTLTNRLVQTQQALSTKSRELDSLKIEWDSRQQELHAKYSQQITSEKEKAFEAQSAYQQRVERERKELEQAHLNIVKQMEAKLYEHDSSNKELTDHKYKNESAIRELRGRAGSLEDELHRSKQEVASLRKENNVLDADYHEQEKMINQLKTRVAVLDQENRDKELVLSKQQSLIDGEHDSRRRCEDELDRKTHQISKMEASMKTMSDELAKGNDIIKKLQGEMRNYHAKVKLRNQIATEQEKLIAGKEHELDSVKQELTTTKQSLKDKLDENSKLSESLESTVKKLEESKQLLKTNENVINWLNKQITETQLSHQRMTAVELVPSSTVNYRPLGSAQLSHSVTSSAMQRSSGVDSEHRTSPSALAPAPTRVPFNYAPRIGGTVNAVRDRRTIAPTKQSPIPEQEEEPETKNKENMNPILDSKYLQRVGVPLRENSLSSAVKPPPTLLAKNQTTKSSSSPSAYFPSSASIS